MVAELANAPESSSSDLTSAASPNPNAPASKRRRRKAVATHALVPGSEAAPRLLRLGHGASVAHVAETCRQAAVAFLSNAHLGWGRRELADWLVGSYASAVVLTRTLPTHGPSIVQPGEVDEFTVQHLLVKTRESLAEALTSAIANDAEREGPGVDLSPRDLIDRGVVTGIADARGEIGYGPVDLRPMRLASRVASLLIADLLTRPDDYRGFALCPECDLVTYDRDGHACGGAGDAPPASGRSRRRPPSILARLVPLITSRSDRDTIRA